jgi:hypothetical protein
MLVFWSANLFGRSKLIFEIKKMSFLLLSASAEHAYIHSLILLRASSGETECDGQTDVLLLYLICTKPYCVRLQMSDWALQEASTRPYCAVTKQSLIRLKSNVFPTARHFRVYIVSASWGFYCGVFWLCVLSRLFFLLFLSFIPLHVFDLGHAKVL